MATRPAPNSVEKSVLARNDWSVVGVSASLRLITSKIDRVKDCSSSIRFFGKNIGIVHSFNGIFLDNEEEDVVVDVFDKDDEDDEEDEEDDEDEDEDEKEVVDVVIDDDDDNTVVDEVRICLTLCKSGRATQRIDSPKVS